MRLDIKNWLQEKSQKENLNEHWRLLTEGGNNHSRHPQHGAAR